MNIHDYEEKGQDLADEGRPIGQVLLAAAKADDEALCGLISQLCELGDADRGLAIHIATTAAFAIRRTRTAREG